MAQAGYAKKISSNEIRKQELIKNFPVGTSVFKKNGNEIIITGHWGDRCIIGNDGNIYNAQADFGYKFNNS